MNLASNLGSIEQHTLFAGTEIPALPTKAIIASGSGILYPGAVLGKVAATGKHKLCNAAATDESKVADLILAETIDATSADVNAVAYKTGIYNYNALYVAEGDTVAAHAEELRLRNIHYRTEI